MVVFLAEQCLEEDHPGIVTQIYYQAREGIDNGLKLNMKWSANSIAGICYLDKKQIYFDIDKVKQEITITKYIRPAVPNGSATHIYYPSKDEPLVIGTATITEESRNQSRMLHCDENPIPLSMKKPKPAPEFDSKCFLCGSPCNKRGKVSVCEGGCQ